MAKKTEGILKNIEKIETSVTDIGEKINSIAGIGIPKISFQDYTKGASKLAGAFLFKTPRQIAKKIITMGGNIGGTTISDKIKDFNNQVISGQNLGATASQTLMALNEQLIAEQDTEMTAHWIVYGKFLYDDNGKLIDNEILYPECVGPDENEDPRINFMTDDFPILDQVKQMKDELVRSVKQLRIKVGEIKSVAKDIPSQLILAITALASAVVIFPFGSGVPPAVSAVKNLLSSIQSLQTRVSQLLNLLKPLAYLEYLLSDEDAEKAIAVVDKIMKIIFVPIKAIEIMIETLVSPVMSLIPKVPGVDTDAEPIEAEDITVKPSDKIDPGTEITLDVNPSKGSWQYNYMWTSTPSGFKSTDKTVKTIPPYTIKFHCKISDKTDASNYIFKSVKIKVG